MKNNKRWTKKRILLSIVVVLIIVLLYQPVYAELLKSSIRNNNVSAMNAILTVPGNVNFRFVSIPLEFVDKTVLDVACMNNDYEMMEILLEHGATPSFGPGPRQPLAHVLGGDYNGMLDRTKLLVEYGAEINIGDGSGEQPTDWLFRRRDFTNPSTLEEANAEVFATMVYLAEQGVWLGQDTYKEYRRLGNTIDNDNYKALEYLVLEQGMDVDVTEDGRTLLMYAAKDGGLKTAELLIEFGVDKSIIDEEGKTAYDYAVENGHLELAELLKP